MAGKKLASKIWERDGKFQKCKQGGRWVTTSTDVARKESESVEAERASSKMGQIQP